MLVPCNIDLITSAANVKMMYAVYTHMDHNGKVHWVGVTPLTELFTLADAYGNSEWSNIFSQPLTTLQIKVHALTDNEREAYLEQRRLIVQHQPICNLKGYYVEPRKQRIQCVETGEIFETITACAQAHNIVYSQLNNHINRKPGHRTVKGRTYIRTMKDVAR